MDSHGRAMGDLTDGMNREAVIRAYRRYAGVYDLLFGPIMHPGRRRIVSTLDLNPGDSVLEVGVGTGLSLPLYPPFVKVTGIDISCEMLDRARQRVSREGLAHVEAIQEMDAQAMSYPDARFDKVVAMYVVSVVPDPSQLVTEMRRVCKPNGEILIVNHFRSRNRVLSGFERMLAPLSRLAGFRPDVALGPFLADTGLEVIDIRSTNLFGYWKIIRCRNRLSQTSAETLPLTGSD
jgi:phosphatidylethanolamine/phosphatidyl-N-methylethanolamine N-methyltransferase